MWKIITCRTFEVLPEDRGSRFLRNTGTQIVPLLYTDDGGRRLLRTYTKLHGVTPKMTAGLRFVGKVGRVLSHECAPNYNVWGEWRYGSTHS